MKKKHKVPGFELIRILIAIGIAVFLALVIIFFTSKEPIEALKYFLIGPLTNLRRMGNVIEAMLPLMFTGLAVCLIARTKVFNLASEGAFFLGGAVAALCAVLLPLPSIALPLVCIMVGGLAGIAVLLIPAGLRTRWGANEIVSSLMLNYVCLYLGLLLIRAFVRNPESGELQSLEFQGNAILPQVVPGTRIHAGVFVAIICAVAAYWFLFRSRMGYKVRIVGENPAFARYSGIKVFSTILLAQAVAGLIAGMGGACEMLGMFTRFKWSALPGYGWDGIIVATLAHNNPKHVVWGALFLAYMRVGADIMTRMTDVQNEVVSIIQGVVIILVVAEGFLDGWKKRRTFKEATEQMKKGGAVV